MNNISMERMQSLIEMTSRIHSRYTDRTALLVCVLESAVSLVPCESSSLFLLDKEDGSFRCVLAFGAQGAEKKDIPADKNTVAGWVAENNAPLVIHDVSADPRCASVVQDKTGAVARTMLSVPLRVKGQCAGAIVLVNRTGARRFSAEDCSLLEAFAAQVSVAYANAEAYRSAQDTIAVLRHNMAAGAGFHPFVASSPALLDLLRVAETVAKTDAAILITGESGTGKEVFAEQLHLKSTRAEKPFVRVNCAAPRESFLEDALFGSGTAADSTASGGTLFLDEIGALPPAEQENVLRLLRERRFMCAGTDTAVDVRVIASTSRNLEQLVSDGTFRSDLYHRLQVLPLHLPPLRERRAAIEPLAQFFLAQFADKIKKPFTGFSDAAMRVLHDGYWQGNIRELKNTVERACLVGTPPLVQRDAVCVSGGAGQSADGAEIACDAVADETVLGDDRTLKTAVHAFKAAYVRRILNETAWNQTEAGKILGVQRTYVSRLLNELHIR